MRALESSAGRRRAVAYLALRENILWALDDEQQQALLALTPADLDGGKADWALALAEVSWLRGDAAQARSYGEVAAAAYAQVLEGWEQAGEREQVMILRAYGLAYAGRVNEAIAEAGRALAFEQQLGLRNAYLPFIFARIYVLANRPSRRSTSSKRRCAVATSFHAGGCASTAPFGRSGRIRDSSGSWRATRLREGLTARALFAAILRSSTPLPTSSIAMSKRDGRTRWRLSAAIAG